MFKGAFLWGDLDYSDHGALKVDSSVPLMWHDPSDLGSLILIQIILKERTLNIPNPELI